VRHRLTPLVKSPSVNKQPRQFQTLTRGGGAGMLRGVGEEGRMAMLLSQVARLEEFALSKIERSGAQEVVQYRGQIMPLVRLSQVARLPLKMFVIQCKLWSMRIRGAASV